MPHWPSKYKTIYLHLCFYCSNVSCGLNWSRSMGKRILGNETPIQPNWRNTELPEMVLATGCTRSRRTSKVKINYPHVAKSGSENVRASVLTNYPALPNFKVDWLGNAKKTTAQPHPTPIQTRWTRHSSRWNQHRKIAPKEGCSAVKCRNSQWSTALRSNQSRLTQSHCASASIIKYSDTFEE